MQYVDQVGSGVTVRTFSSLVPDSELVWHRDEFDREIELVSGMGWKFQFDNELPFEIREKFMIPAGQWHRLIKGEGDLVIKIVEKNVA